MTLTDKIKLLNDKIKTNQAQYNLDREATKISALSSKYLDKYEYLTGKVLGYKPEVLEKVKSEYSLLGEVFNKRLELEDKKKGILKRLGNIKDANEKQLQTIIDEHLKLLIRIKDDKPKPKSLRHQINKEDKEQLKYFENLVKLELSINYTKLYYQSGNRYKDTFNFMNLGQ